MSLKTHLWVLKSVKTYFSLNFSESGRLLRRYTTRNMVPGMSLNYYGCRGAKETSNVRLDRESPERMRSTPCFAILRSVAEAKVRWPLRW